MQERLIVGCMTGTSVDGIDAALVRITGEGLAITATIEKTASAELGKHTDQLRAFANGEPMKAANIAVLAHALGLRHAETIKHLCTDQPIDLIAVHGQTVFHSSWLPTWQMIDPWPIVNAIKAPVVFDLRRADTAAKGEGAPITPLADWIMFRTPQHYTAAPRRQNHRRAS